MIYLLGFLSLIFLIYLIIEHLSINKYCSNIPLRITVTGSRGKSSVVRMLASVLREEGYITLAKTTGSEACYILPNGKIEKISRNRLISIIEQKRFLKKASDLNVNSIVGEIMSLQPENHYIESQRILKPHKTVITNIRLDHTDIMGDNIEEISKIFSLDIYHNSEVYLLRDEFPILKKDIKKKKSQLILCQNQGENILYQNRTSIKNFPDNLDQVYMICKGLNIKKQTIISGVEKTNFDLGEFKIWDLPDKNLYLVNAFSGNDPYSTKEILVKTKALLKNNSTEIMGILNLRSDRPARTQQWIDYFKKNPQPCFKQLFVYGGFSTVFKRKIKWAKILTAKNPLEIMNTFDFKDKKGIVFGFGNIKGMGEKIINYCQEYGREYEF